VHVTKRDERKSVLPPRLSHLAKLLPQDSINNNSPRTIALTMAQMNWLLNGHKFELVGVAENERVRLNTQESWLLTNDETAGDGGGMMSGMKMPHPIHIHGVQFQIADRQVSPEHRADWETIGRGHVDEGWKDTVLVMPGERVKLLIRFEEYAGLFLYHCHNLEHEDMGMMRNYLIQS
jgi:FtsP/CotA-like multicopper oxidase with cupredoxin domain